MAACSFVEEKPEEKTPEADYSIYNIDEEADKGPVKGGVLNLFTTEPDTFNPISTKNTYIRDFLGLIYEGLVSLDASQKPVPCLSDEWNVSEDCLVWNFHIREGIKWHDGSELTAADVESTCNFILNGSIDTGYKSKLANVASFAAIDSNNFRIVLKKPFSYMVEMMNFPILQKNVLQNEIIIQQNAEFKPIGTGPYKFDSYEKGKCVKLIANENWWDSNGKDKAGLPKQPYINAVEVKIYKSSNDAIDAFQSRETDLLYIEDAEYEKYSSRSDIVIKKFPGRSFDFLAFNLSKPLTGLKSVRNAISMCIDKDRLLKNNIPNTYLLADLPVIPGTWLENTASNSIGHDISTAEGLLTQDGFKKDSTSWYRSIKGVRKRLDLELLVNTENKARLDIAKEISNELEEAGIKIKITAVKWDEIFSKVNSGKFDILLTGIRVPMIPDVSYLYSYPYINPFSANGYRIASNITGYNNAAVNGYIEKIFSEPDESKRKDLYNYMKSVVQDEQPYIGLCFYNNAVVFNKRIRGGICPNTWNKFYGISTWYIP